MGLRWVILFRISSLYSVRMPSSSILAMHIYLGVCCMHTHNAQRTHLCYMRPQQYNKCRAIYWLPSMYCSVYMTRNYHSVIKKKRFHIYHNANSFFLNSDIFHVKCKNLSIQLAVYFTVIRFKTII